MSMMNTFLKVREKPHMQRPMSPEALNYHFVNRKQEEAEGGRVRFMLGNWPLTLKCKTTEHWLKKTTTPAAKKETLFLLA